LDGSSPTWISFRAASKKALEAGEMIPVLQTVPEPFDDLPHVPLAINYAKTPEAKQLIEVGIHGPSIFSRAFTLPPQTPNEQVRTLTTAFMETLKDRDFLADTQRAKLDIEPVTAKALEKSVASLFHLEKGMLEKLRDILFK